MCIYCHRKGADGTLSSREADVLRLLMTGEPYKIIALALGITQRTVRNHAQQIRKKLGAKNQAEAIVMGLQRGIIALPEAPDIKQTIDDLERDIHDMVLSEERILRERDEARKESRQLQEALDKAKSQLERTLNDYRTLQKIMERESEVSHHGG